MTALRAMTLVEVVMSLALLGLLAVAMAGWTTFSAKAQSAISSETSWRMAATETLSLVADSVASGDELYREDRVIIEHGELTIITRDRLGPCTQSVALADGRLVLRRDGAGGEETTILLDRVASFEPVMDLEARILAIAIVRDDGVRVTRMWTVP